MSINVVLPYSRRSYEGILADVKSHILAEKHSQISRVFAVCLGDERPPDLETGVIPADLRNLVAWWMMSSPQGWTLVANGGTTKQQWIVARMWAEVRKFHSESDEDRAALVRAFGSDYLLRANVEVLDVQKDGVYVLGAVTGV